MRWKQKPEKLPVFDRFEWNPYFAWFPVEVDGTWVWLETIRRKRIGPGCSGGFWWEYRL